MKTEKLQVVIRRRTSSSVAWHRPWSYDIVTHRMTLSSVACHCAAAVLKRSNHWHRKPLLNDNIYTKPDGTTLLLSKHDTLSQCWAHVVEGGPTFNQHWINISSLPGWYTFSAQPSKPQRSYCLHSSIARSYCTMRSTLVFTKRKSTKKLHVLNHNLIKSKILIVQYL